MKYYFREDKITYCEGPQDEMSKGAIEVAKRPSIDYKYDFEKKVWLEDIENKRKNIRPIRNSQLKRTDHYFLIDNALTPEEIEIGSKYRQALRDVPNHDTCEEIVMPKCPDFMIN